nr:hypothetical protein GCM10020093_065530 [Planobispora longispora]
MAESTAGTGRNASASMRSSSRQPYQGHVCTVSMLQRPKSPVRLRAYSSWVSSVAEVRDGARRHQSTIFEVIPYGMFPATANGSRGARAARKSPRTTRMRGSVRVREASFPASSGSTS